MWEELRGNGMCEETERLFEVMQVDMKRMVLM